MAVKPRKWTAWALIEPDGTLYGVRLTDPREFPPVRELLALGWTVIALDMTEK